MFFIPFYLLSILPYGLLYGISGVLFFIVYYCCGYSVSTVKAHLARIFTDQSWAEHKVIMRRFYTYLCDLWLEYIKALTITPEQLTRRVKVHADSTLLENYRCGRSVFFWGGYLGNWEWVFHALALKGPYNLSVYYRDLHVKYVNHIAFLVRTRFGRQVMGHDDVFKYLLTYNGAPRAFTLLLDRLPLSCNGLADFTFLGQKKSFSLVWAKLAQKCNWPIYYLYVEYTARGKYEVTPILLAQEPRLLSWHAITQLYVKQLEENILALPHAWFCMHQRWEDEGNALLL